MISPLQPGGRGFVNLFVGGKKESKTIYIPAWIRIHITAYIHNKFVCFSGESMDAEAMILIMDYKEVDGVEKPCILAFKHGLEEEKC